MREIKFRAWHPLLKKMLNSDGIADYDAVHSIDILEWHRERKWCLMQYTGLKDKNGKEIYEGDIVKAQFKNHKNVGEVFFSNGSFCWGYDMNPIQWENEETTPTDTWAEVIGNIYENPELLEN